MHAGLGLLVAISSFVAQAPAAVPGAPLEIVVQEATGEVDFQLGDTQPWVAARNGDKLAVGARVCTGTDSNVLIAFGTNSVTWV